MIVIEDKIKQELDTHETKNINLKLFIIVLKNIVQK